jgi:hypothetical protein
MDTLYKLLFSLSACLFVAFFLGQNLSVESPCHEKHKIENTSDSPGSFTGCNMECFADEDGALYLHSGSDQSFHTQGENLLLQACILPSNIYFSIWLPPDIS